jgi:hypothetical protein
MEDLRSEVFEHSSADDFGCILLINTLISSAVVGSSTFIIKTPLQMTNRIGCLSSTTGRQNPDYFKSLQAIN